MFSTVQIILSFPILHNSPVKFIVFNLLFCKRVLYSIFVLIDIQKTGIIWALDSVKWIEIFKINGWMNNFVIEYIYIYIYIYAGHCWRSRDELIRDDSYGPPHMGVQKQDDQHEHTFSSYMRILDVVLKTCLGRWTIGRSGERGSGISVLPARHNDDDDIYIYTLVSNVFQFPAPTYMYACDYRVGVTKVSFYILVFVLGFQNIF